MYGRPASAANGSECGKCQMPCGNGASRTYLSIRRAHAHMHALASITDVSSGALLHAPNSYGQVRQDGAGLCRAGRVKGNFYLNGGGCSRN